MDKAPNHFRRIASLTDVNYNEQLPLSERHLAANTYDIFKRSAKQYNDKIALRFLLQGTANEASFNYSYNDLLTRITQSANAFKHLNISSEAVVSILLPNLPQNHFALWGAEAVGIANPINPLLDSAHIISIMNQTKATVLVTLAPFPGTRLWAKAQQIVENVPTLETILTVDLRQYLPEGQRPPAEVLPTTVHHVSVKDFDAYLQEHAGDAFESTKTGDDTASFFHTGGTTGAPKIAMQSHANQVFSAWMVGKQLDWNETDVMHCGLPMFHVNAPLITGLAPFTVGGEIIMTSPQGFRSPTVLDHFASLIEKYKISFFMTVPTIYVELNKRWKDKVDASTLASLKFVACGAAPMPPAVAAQFEQITNRNIIHGYGLTEGTVFSTATPPFADKKIKQAMENSIGIRIPYQDMQVAKLDDKGKLVSYCATDEIGTLIIHGPNVFQGYLNSKDNADTWVAPGWLNTGDLGRQSKDGYFYLSGRKKDLIIRGGHNIDPKLIEEALSQHPSIALVAAIGAPDKRAGELPIAYVMLNEGANISEQELEMYARKHIAEAAAFPTKIYIIDHMPLTAVGKIYKPQLRLDAIKKVLEQALLSLINEGNMIKIEVQADALHGQKAIVTLENAVSPETVKAIQSCLEGFPVVTEIKENQTCINGGIAKKLN